MRATNKEKKLIIKTLNPKGSNYKNCNYFRIITRNKEHFEVEVGFWITYTNCKPIYQKEIHVIRTPTKK